MIINEQILNLIRQKGPMLPAQVAKQINDSVLITSARLSELLSNKKINISSLKIGGSPLYYVPGQEIKLQDYSDNLGSKEKEAYNLLKEKKVLRDAALEPAIRVALRLIKDFSVPLEISYEGKTELFWRWYLTGNNEVQEKINLVLSKKEIAGQNIHITKDIPLKEDITSKIEPTKKYEQIHSDILPTSTGISDLKEHEPMPKIDPREKTQVSKTKIDKNYLLNQSNKFFNKNRINIKEAKEIKRNNEMDFVVELETSIGMTKYFCKAKNKKRINESDLSTAIVQAQSKGLPLLFLATGEISKKTKEKLETDFKNIIYREI